MSSEEASRNQDVPLSEMEGLKMITDEQWQRPGLPEILTGLAAYAGLLVLFGLLMALLPAGDPVLLGIVGSTAGGFVGIGAFAAACSLRIRALRPFGFRAVSGRWLLIAAAMGVVGYCLSLGIQSAYFSWFGGDNPQGILHAATRGGPLPFVLSLLGGAFFTPVGEEILFRGVIANALNRYGAFAGILLSYDVDDQLLLALHPVRIRTPLGLSKTAEALTAAG